MNVLLGTSDRELLSQIDTYLGPLGYQIFSDRDCHSLSDHAKRIGIGIDAVLIDSGLVGSSKRRGENLISGIRRSVPPETPILVLMTRPLSRVPTDIQASLAESDGVIHMPVRPADVYTRLESSLTLAR